MSVSHSCEACEGAGCSDNEERCSACDGTGLKRGVVRVRIAVVVNKDGDWSAHGWSDRKRVTATDEDMRRTALDCVTESDCERVYFVEATLELPTQDAPATVEGSVADAG